LNTIMNHIDIAILLFVLLFIVSGFFRGLFREVISVLCMLGGFLLAVWKTNWLADMFPAIFSWASHLVFVGIFIVLFSVGSFFLSRILGFLYHQMKSPSLDIFQRTGGSFLGFFKGVLFASLLTLLFSVFSIDQKMNQEKEMSLFYKPIQVAAPAVLHWATNIFNQTKSNYPKVKEQFKRMDSKSRPLPHSQEPLQKHDQKKIRRSLQDT